MTTWTEVYTFGDLVVRGAQNWPNRDAVVIDDEAVTYGELERRARAVASSLHGLGVRRGDHVGLLMPNCMAGIEVLLGAALLGAVPVPINTRFAARELRHVIIDGDLKVVVTGDSNSDRVSVVDVLGEALPGLSEASDPTRLSLDLAPILDAVVLWGATTTAGFVTLDHFRSLGRGVDPEEVERLRRMTALRDRALMLYTSGTTAVPKGCPLSNEALVRTAVEAGRTRFRLLEGDRFWDPLPLFHMSFILPLISVLDAGGTFMSMTHFDATAALQQLSRAQVDVIYPTFPAITQAILNHPDYEPALFSRVRVAVNVAPPDALRSMQEAVPAAVQISAYGLTECSGVVAFNDPADSLEQRISTQGVPFAGVEVCAKDESGVVLPPGERGELCVRGYSVFDGYYKDEATTAAAFDAEGWFHTGDLGSVDVDGRISYQGRIKDMLKVGGENVAAVEIESVLSTHPAVSIAQVVGVPDNRLSEVPAAFVELKPGAEATEQELIDHCGRAMARFKVPRHVRFVTEWPMSATKVQKFRLRDRLIEELGL